LEEWDSVKSGFNDAKFVDMLEQVDDESNDTDSVVVSTMERIHRDHFTDECKSEEIGLNVQKASAEGMLARICHD